MILINLLLSTLLLLNSCFNEVVARDNGNIQFTDLNLDVLHLIFDQLALPELIYMAETSSKFINIAGSVYRQKYKDYEIRVVTGKGHNNFEQIRRSYSHEKYFEITDSEWIEDIFKHTGKWFKKLSIKSNAFGYRSKKLNEIINKYTCESLIALDLGCIETDTFEHFTMPFKEVETLHFTVNKASPSANMLPLNQLFPKLRRLNLYLNAALEHNLLDCEFPHLESVRAEFGYSRSEIQTEQLESLFRRNPHIRIIDLKCFSSDYVRKINELLPNLEDLTLHELSDLNERVHLENVKNLRLFVAYPRAIRSLSCPRLEFLDIDYYGSFGELITFFRNHQDLGKLKLANFERSPDGQALVNLIANLPNLNELVIAGGKPYSIEFIDQIIQSHKKLTKIQFPVELMAKYHDGFKQIIGKYKNEWNLKDLDQTYIFEKKF